MSRQRVWTDTSVSGMRTGRNSTSGSGLVKVSGGRGEAFVDGAVCEYSPALDMSEDCFFFLFPAILKKPITPKPLIGNVSNKSAVAT